MAGGHQKEEKAPEENVKTLTQRLPIQNYVRIRPYMASEEKVNAKDNVCNERACIEIKDEKEVHVLQPVTKNKNEKILPADATTKKKFGGFDKAFYSFGDDQENDQWAFNPHTNYSNEQVYKDTTEGMIDSCFDGFNQSFMTYGPINGGKTHTMYGTDENHGIVPRMLADIVAQIPAEVEKRRAPEEELKITVECQAVRIFKEEIEDLLNKGKPIQPGKGGATDDEATRLVLEEKEQFDKVMKVLLDVRSPSHVTTPNKHNRAHVVVRLIIKHHSMINSDGPEKVESKKEATMTLAELGAGPKADKESTVDYKKINQGGEAWKAVLMKLKEGKNKKDPFLPCGQSTVTRHLQVATHSANARMMLCVGPHHKNSSLNELWLGLASDIEGFHITASKSESEDLAQLRDQLQKKREEEVSIVRAKDNMLSVKKELERTASRLRELEQRKKELEAACENTEDDIAQLEKEIEDIKKRFAQQREATRNVLASYDRRYETAIAEREAAEKKMQGLPELIVQCEKDLKALTEVNAIAEEALGEFQSVQAMFGDVSGADEMRKEETEEEIAAAKANLSNADEILKRQQDAAVALQTATKRLKDTLSMDQETTELLKLLQEAIKNENEADAKCDDAARQIRRAKRRYLKELLEALEATKTSVLADVSAMIPADDTDIKEPKDEFIRDEIEKICLCLIESEQQSVTAPGWATWKEVCPVNAWLTSQYKKGDAAGTGTFGSQEELSIQFDLDNVTYEGLTATGQLIEDCHSWSTKLLAYARNRQAVEDAYAEWLERMPAWPQQANMIMELIAKRDKLVEEAKALEEEAAKITKEEVEPEQKNLEAANKDVAAKEALKKKKQADLEEAVAKCNCNIL